MGGTVHVDVKSLLKVLDRFERRAKNIRPLMPTIAQILVTAVEDEFETEGRGRWPDLAPSTIRQRRKGGAGAKILQDTGVLVGSIRPDHGADFAEAGTDVPYIVYHLEGGPKIPKRNPFEVDLDEVYDEVIDLLTTEIARG